MNTDIRVSILLPRHWKYKRLKRLLGLPPMELLIVFWGTVAEQVPNGELRGWSVADIEDAAGWEGEAGAFCQAMLDSELLDKTADGFYPHDWVEHQPWVVGAKERSEIARKAGQASAEARRKASRSAKKQRPVEQGVEQGVDTELTPGSADVQPPVISMILNDKTEHGVTEADFQRYSELFPAVDVMQELRNMKAWLFDNPARRKTRSGVKAFITKWLIKEQNRGGHNGRPNTPGGAGPIGRKTEGIESGKPAILGKGDFAGDFPDHSDEW